MLRVKFKPRNTAKIYLNITVLCFLVFLTSCVGPQYQSLEGPLGGRKGGATIESGSNLPESSEIISTNYIVKKGDTLYSIAFRYKLDLDLFAMQNRLAQPYTIYPGETLQLIEFKGEVDSSVSPVLAQEKPSIDTKNDVILTEEIQIIDVKPVENVKKTAWAWPVSGNIVRTFDGELSGSAGIDIVAQLGDSVMAAADGKVVYAGNGLRGYGNLVIIEHPGQIMSAYAHNQKILVEEQALVSKGQSIAIVGLKDEIPTLHFEIRKNGRPVDPQLYLP